MRKDFCARHSQPKTDHVIVIALCKLFLEKSDGIKIFTKFPSLIRPSIKRWEINEAIRLLGLQTEEGFNKLYDELCTAVSLESPRDKPPSRPAKVAPSRNAISTSDQNCRIYVGSINW